MMAVSRVSRRDSQATTRSRLRRAAARAFACEGIAGSRIEAIAQDAGYSKGAFYANYRSKLDLLIDLLHEKQSAEIELWRDVLSHSVDVDADLAQLAARYEGLTNVRERAMLSNELQLEADRNEAFRPVFRAYLDGVYAETRQLFELMFERHGKAVPEALDSFIVTVRLLGIGLGSPSLTETEAVQRSGAGQIMLHYLRGIVAAAPIASEK